VSRPRIDHAIGEAQGARFEHGEDGTPEPYYPAAPDRETCVYVAGPVIEGEGVLGWREEIFQRNTNSGGRGWLQANEFSLGRFWYAGPSINGSHGVGDHGLAQRCLAEVKGADVLFAWIDREDTVGTLIEIGVAYAHRKPIFVAFATAELSQHFYFGRDLTTVTVVASDALAAWKLFVQWRDREESVLTDDD
jgi:hypothetical protein